MKSLLIILNAQLQGENSLVGNFTAISHQWWEMVGNGGKFPTSGGKWWEISHHWWEIIKKFTLVKNFFLNFLSHCVLEFALNKIK